MTITFQLWMLIPAVLVVGAVVMLWKSENAGGGMLAGLFEGLAGIALLMLAGAFMLGRWLA